jgi:hypothetical protein
MGPAVVPGQDLGVLPGRYATVRRQIRQGVTGSWVTVIGKRTWLAHRFYDASPVRVTLPAPRRAPG